MTKFATALAALGLTVGLAACGSGTGSEETATTPTASQPVAAAPVESPPTVEATPTVEPTPTVEAVPTLEASGDDPAEVFCLQVEEFIAAIERTQLAPSAETAQELARQTEDLAAVATELSGELADDPASQKKIRKCSEQLEQFIQ